MLYGLYAVWCCIAVCSYSAVWRCMAVWRRGGGVTRRVRCMERHTAKYSEIQRNSVQPAIQPCRACRGSGAWPGCAQAAVHAAMGAGYRPTPGAGQGGRKSCALMTGEVAEPFRWLCSTGCMLKFFHVSTCHASVMCLGGPPWAATQEKVLPVQSSVGLFFCVESKSTL